MTISVLHAQKNAAEVAKMSSATGPKVFTGTQGQPYVECGSVAQRVATSLKKRLRPWTDDAPHTAAHVAEALEVSKDTVFNWVNKRAMPGPELLGALFGFFASIEDRDGKNGAMLMEVFGPSIGGGKTIVARDWLRARGREFSEAAE